MIETKAGDITVESNLDVSDSFDMGFDESSIVHIMSVLTDLYSDQALAVIREYSTNARDAHIETGQKRPIEIRLPNNLYPYLEVEDWGPGMDLEMLRNVYSKYGASTKRGTNEQVGMLGMGSKAGLTYADQFVVTSTKDGVRRSMSVGRKEDGRGVIEIADTIETPQPNGTKIVIQVKDSPGLFNLKANTFFSFWEPGTVLVNGKEPVNPWNETKVTDNIYIFKNNNNMDYVVMGNVAYPVSANHSLYQGNRNFGIVAYVPIGAINFTPSREALRYTPRTLEHLEKVRKEFVDGYAAAITKEIEQAADHATAMEAYNRWGGVLGFNGLMKDVKYKGKNVPSVVMFASDAWLYYTKRSKNRITREDKIYTSTTWLKNSLFVTGFDLRSVSASHREKIDKYIVDNDIDAEHVYIMDDYVGDDWFAWIPSVNFAEIKKIQLPKKSSGSGGGVSKSVVGSYRTVNKAERLVEVTDLKTTDKVFYTTSQYAKHRRDALALLTNYLDGARLLVVEANRMKKFKETFPQAQPIETLLDKLRAEMLTMLTDDDKFHMGLDWSMRYRCENLKPENIDDPELKRLVTVAQAKYDTSRIDKRSGLEKMLQRFGHRGWSNPAVSIGNAFRNYPLLNHLDSRSNFRHAERYINMIYKEGV